MNAVFRCDATADIGFGHLSRCIALAEALRLYEVSCTFAGLFDAAAAGQIAAAGFGCNNLPSPVNSETGEQEPAEIEANEGPDFIVVDSYRADARYLRAIKSLGAPVVLIDDFAKLESYPCDVVLNFTWEAPSLAYPSGPVMLLGPKYLLARRQLVERRSPSLARERSGAIRNLLIAIGGSDPKGITGRILRVLGENKPDICIHAISATEAELSPFLSNFAPGSQIFIRLPDLSEQLEWADAAITGGGLIKYESAYMAVPAAAIAQNEGQDGETRELSRAGLVFDLGLADSVSDKELADALGTFLSDSVLRSDMASRMQETFVPDPTAHAAQAILGALRD